MTDNTSRRRVIRTPIVSAWAGTAPISSSLDNNVGLAQHQIYMAASAKPSTGVVQVSMRPAGFPYFIAVQSIDLSINGSGQQLMAGLFDGIQLQFTTALSGGTVNAGVISTGTSFTPSPNRSLDDRRRFVYQSFQSWNGSGAVTMECPTQGGYSQHQLAIVGGTGFVTLLGRPTGESYYVAINSDTQKINAAGSIVLFPGMYDAFQLIPNGSLTGTISAQIAGCGEELPLPILPWQLNAAGIPYVSSFNGRSGPVSLTSSDVSSALGYVPANPATFVSSFKNKLINPDFDFWQRGTTGSGNAYLADRWIAFSGGSTVAVSQQAFAVGQSSVPNNPSYFHRCVVTSVAGAGNFVIQVQRVENVGTLAGSSVTVSFWAKSDANRNMSVNFAQAFGTGGSPSSQVEVNGQTVSLTTAWQYFKLTFSLPSISGKTLGTNGDSFLQLRFWFDAGSNYNALSNNLGQQSGTFDIAQVQLETGSTATPFEVRPTGLELLLCQRYYEKSYDPTTNPGTPNADGYYQYFLSNLTSADRSIASTNPYKVSKRAVPTITIFSYSTGASGKAEDASGSSAVDVSPSGVSSGLNTLELTLSQAAAQAGINLVWHWSADAEL